MSGTNRWWIAVSIVLLVVGLAACDTKTEEPAPAPAPTGPTAAELAYRNALTEPPPGWTGPVFELSHDYPTSDPGPCPETTCGWLYQDVDFSNTDYVAGGWAAYMETIHTYISDGNSLDSSGWNVTVGGETRWFHVPWMTYNTKQGREFIHGMTNERTATLSDLLGNPHGLPNVPGSAGQFETWAFGIYNPWGGYAFGQSWDSGGDPVMKSDPTTLPAGLPFPEGTLVTKLLFTTATPEAVGYLEGSPEWTADRHIETGGCERSPQPVWLVQVDVAVVDKRSPTGWVYGTYGYNGTIKSPDPWDRLSPLGVQWGADGSTFPAVPQDQSQPIAQTALAQVNIYEHFGCEGRLVGPVDNPMASCMSCHNNGFAHSPPGSLTTIGSSPADGNVPPIYGFSGICTTYAPATPPTDNVNVLYFTDRALGVIWPQYPDNFAIDTSLQMLVAFQSYGIFTTNGQPGACTPDS